MEAGETANAKFESLDRRKICRYVSSLRAEQSCIISDQFTHGGFNLVIEIVFDDGVFWIARIRFDTDLADHQRRIMESEISTMQYVREHTTIPVPELHASDSGKNNPFQAPFILMEGVTGWEPDWNNLSADLQGKIIHQMAGIKVKLGNLRFPKIGSLQRDESGKYYIDSIFVGGKTAGPFDSARDYYSYFAESAWQDRVNQDYQDDESRRNRCFLPWLYRCIVPFIIHEDLNHGPFPLSHVDFGRHNILVDDFGVVTGVVDWSQARTLPWESFCTFPVLMSVNWPKRHKYSDWVWKELMTDQECFLKAITEIEKDKGFQTMISELIRSDEVKAAEAVESYFNAPWYRDGWCKPLFHLIFGESVDMEQIKEAVCSSFFAFRRNRGNMEFVTSCRDKF